MRLVHEVENDVGVVNLQSRLATAVLSLLYMTYKERCKVGPDCISPGLVSFLLKNVDHAAYKTRTWSSKSVIRPPKLVDDVTHSSGELIVDPL